MPSERVALENAVGRILAEQVSSQSDLPSSSTSAMDGWVVAGNEPWQLGHPVYAGDPPDGRMLEPGTARPIATGGVIPPGALGVLRSEHGVVEPGAGARTGTLRRAAGARPDEPRFGEHVRVAGEEAQAGERLIMAGRILTPPRVALAAVSGHDTLAVRVRPRVACVLLGSEVVTSGIPAPGSVRDAYSPQFPALLASLGAESVSIARVRDDLAATVRALREASGPRVREGDGGADRERHGETDRGTQRRAADSGGADGATDVPGGSFADLIVTTGGSARGSTDHMRAALAELGATRLIDGVAMRPGHPVILSRLPGGALVLCLPGNPLAAMMTLLTIGVPVLDGILGRVREAIPAVRLASAVANPRNSSLVLAYSQRNGSAEPLSRQGSAMLRGLADAHGVLVVPPGGAESGDEVATLPVPW